MTQVFLAQRKLVRWAGPSPPLAVSLSGCLWSVHCVPGPCAKCCCLPVRSHFITMITLLGEPEAQKGSMLIHVQTAGGWKPGVIAGDLDLKTGIMNCDTVLSLNGPVSSFCRWVPIFSPTSSALSPTPGMSRAFPCLKN